VRPEEWREGMENEAASVEDAGWARETHSASCYLVRRPLLWDALLSVVFVTVNGYVFTILVASLIRYTLRLDANPIGA
jgi:hypothetical protein